MALPKLNSAPKYALTIPSTGQEIYFRPFLVKEQKVLLIAYESKDRRQIVKAILDTVEACVETEIDSRLLTTFDVDYLFTQIRAKSVGEKVDLKVKCTHCEHFNDVQVNLEEIQVPEVEGSRVVELNEEISIKLQYPSYFQFIQNPKILESESDTETVMEVIIACMESIQTEEENILLKDESRDEIVRFLDSMTSEQFEKISTFVQQMPAMKKDIDFTCVSCDETTEVVLQGIDDFF